MKILKAITILFYLLFFMFVQAQTPMKFIHPGGVNGQTELDFVKAKIAAKQQPWYGFYNQMKAGAKSGSNAKKQVNSNDNAIAGPARDDGWKAYSNALTWYFTDQEVYAEQAIAILNAWAIFESFTGGNDQDKLQAGWMGAIFGPAAEIMRDYPGWKPADIKAVQNMFRKAYYPQLKTSSNWNGNVDLTQIDALMNIAVFCEDEAEFNLGISRLRKRNPAYFYLASDAASSRNYGGSSFPGNWFGPVLLLEGLTQESCRDNNHHAQFAMASALHASEVAWNQGVDIYTENTKRYTATMELIATQILTGLMQGTCANNKTTVEYIDTWEIGYNHYHNRMGVEMPNTEKLIKNFIRLKGSSYLNIFFETLTHADIDYTPSIIADVIENTGISIYPNPSSNGNFQINSEVNWEVWSTKGCRLKTGIGNTIDLSNHKCGIYILKTKNQVSKIIIN